MGEENIAAIFSSKMILFPINVNQNHWSIFVLLNIESVQNKNTQISPCLMYLDSMGQQHDNRDIKYSDIIFDWLNQLWATSNTQNRTHKEEMKPFNNVTIKMMKGKVAQQPNGYDCGVYVCIYMYTMYQFSNCEFNEVNIQEVMTALYSISHNEIIELRNCIQFILKELK